MMVEHSSMAQKESWDTASRTRPGTTSLSRPAGLGSAATSGQEQPPDASSRDTEAKYQALLSTIADLVFWVRKDGVILRFQKPRDSELPLAAQDVIGKRLMELLPPQIGPVATHYLEKALRTHTPQVFACQYLLPGRLRDFEARLAVSGPGEVVALVRDVTDRKLLEREIIEISHREQMRIGQDLHDGLGQHLTGITFLSKALERKLAVKNMPEAGEAAEISNLVVQALSQSRSLARGLFPVELESNGLVPAFQELAATVAKIFNITCTFECDDTFVVRNRTLATHLFRLAQEAINNAVRHGKAKRVSLFLRACDEKMVLTISDDGLGFPQGGMKAKGLGLRIMSYRAQKIGGTLDIQPGQPTGTVVTCTFCNAPEENPA
jgi:two-component system CheB/CheR fusion protein